MSAQFSFIFKGPIPSIFMQVYEKGEAHIRKAFVDEYRFSPKPIKENDLENYSGWLFFSKFTPIFAYEFRLNFSLNQLEFKFILVDESNIQIMQSAKDILFKELNATASSAVHFAGLKLRDDNKLVV